MLTRSHIHTNTRMHTHMHAHCLVVILGIFGKEFCVSKQVIVQNKHNLQLCIKFGQ